MRRSLLAVTVGAASLLAPFATVTAAQAAPQGEPVWIVAHTTFESEVSDFESSLGGLRQRNRGQRGRRPRRLHSVGRGLQRRQGVHLRRRGVRVHPAAEGALRR